jgi:hypothetical protein
LRETKSFGEDLPMSPIYGGVQFDEVLVVGKPKGVVERKGRHQWSLWWRGGSEEEEPQGVTSIPT